MNIRPSAAELARREAERRAAAAESAYGRLLREGSELARVIQASGGTPSTRLPATLGELAQRTGGDPRSRSDALEWALEGARMRVEALRAEAGTAAARAAVKESEVAALLETLADNELTEVAARQPGEVREADASRALDALLERASAVLYDDPSWPGLRERAEAVRRIEDAQRRRNELAALKVTIGERVSSLRQRRRWAESLDSLLDSAAHVSGARVAAVVKELSDLRDAGEPVGLEPYAERLAEAVAAEEAAADRERATRVVLDTLEELGYTVVPETMGTALVKDGRLVIQRHPGDEHGLELKRADVEGGSHLRTEIVRLRPGAGDQARRRDYEREEAWCREHAVIRGRLADNGFTAELMMKREPGTAPMRTVATEGAGRDAAARSEAGRRIEGEEGG